MGARSILFADAEKVALALGIAPADQHSRTKFALLQVCMAGGWRLLGSAGVGWCEDASARVHHKSCAGPV